MKKKHPIPNGTSKGSVNIYKLYYEEKPILCYHHFKYLHYSSNRYGVPHYLVSVGDEFQDSCRYQNPQMLKTIT